MENVKNGIERMFASWSSQRLDTGKTFDETFQVDGISLWRVFERFVTSSLLPKPLFSFSQLCDDFELGVCHGPSRFRIWLLARGFALNERLSWRSPFPHTITSNPKALFLTYSNHAFPSPDGVKLYRVQAVVDMLKKHGTLEPFVVMAHPLSKRFTQRKSVSSIPLLYNFIDPDSQKKAASLARVLAHEWTEISVREKERALAVDEHSFYPFISRHLQFLFSYSFLSVFFTYYFTLKNITASHNVRAFYLTASIGLFEKCCLMVAKLLDIPVFVAQHGAGVGFGNLDECFLDNVTFLVFGKKHQEQLVQMGVAPERIAVTGSPMVDELAARVPEKSTTLKHILILTQPFVEDSLWTVQQRDAFFATLRTLMQSFSDATFSFKIHPRERKELYEKKFPGVPVATANLYDEIVSSDIVVGVTSTSLMEALLLNRPVVVLDLFEQARELPFVVSELALWCEHAEGIKPAVDSYLGFYHSPDFDRKREQFIADYFSALDGKAAERIVRLVQQSLEKSI